MTKVDIRFFYDPKDNWDCNYNNQDFFTHNIERLRWCLIDLKWLDGNNFAGCVDLETLEIKNTLEGMRLAMMSHDELIKMVDDKGWDWLGDDFDHMENYLSFICEHDESFMYNARPVEGDEYLAIQSYKIPKEFRTGKLREAYLAGQEDAEMVVK